MLNTMPADRFVEYCYHRILGRQPDKKGLAYYIELLQAGSSYLDIIDLFLSSREYRDKSRILGLSNPFLSFAPPGHFDSPLPDYKSLVELYYREKQSLEVRGIDLNLDGQLSLLKDLARHYPQLPWTNDCDVAEKGKGEVEEQEAVQSKDRFKQGPRYSLDNSSYAWGDGIVLYALLKEFKPRRIIEVGSGYSSAAILDVLEAAGLRSNFSIIDPFPGQLYDLLKARDNPEMFLTRERVENVPLALFGQLEKNDLLLVDSSHTVKFSSDVLYVITKVLPALQNGVLIHFHDVFWPFEYPLPWLLQGRAWNEAYFLRSFLMYNKSFKILYFNDLIGKKYGRLLGKCLPLARANPGQSLWLIKDSR